VSTFIGQLLVVDGAPVAARSWAISSRRRAFLALHLEDVAVGQARGAR
jgi:hypothetical protein